jgi:hypothetical protein
MPANYFAYPLQLAGEPLPLFSSSLSFKGLTLSIISQESSAFCPNQLAKINIDH